MPWRPSMKAICFWITLQGNKRLPLNTSTTVTQWAFHYPTSLSMEEIYSTGSGFKCIPNFSSSQFKASGLFKSSSKRTVALKQNSFFVFTWTVFLCRAVEEGYKSILWRLLSWKLLTSFDQLWLLKPFTVFSSSSKWVFTPKGTADLYQNYVRKGSGHHYHGLLLCYMCTVI